MMVIRTLAARSRVWMLPDLLRVPSVLFLLASVSSDLCEWEGVINFKQQIFQVSS